MPTNNTTHKQAWFIHVRRSYLPNSWKGLSIYVLYVAYLVAMAVDWYRLGHSFWELLTAVVPLVVAAALVTQYIASKNSK